MAPAPVAKGSAVMEALLRMSQDKQPHERASSEERLAQQAIEEHGRRMDYIRRRPEEEGQQRPDDAAAVARAAEILAAAEASKDAMLDSATDDDAAAPQLDRGLKRKRCEGAEQSRPAAAGPVDSAMQERAKTRACRAWLGKNSSPHLCGASLPATSARHRRDQRVSSHA